MEFVCDCKEWVIKSLLKNLSSNRVQDAPAITKKKLSFAPLNKTAMITQQNTKTNSVFFAIVIFFISTLGSYVLYQLLPQ